MGFQWRKIYFSGNSHFGGNYPFNIGYFCFVAVTLLLYYTGKVDKANWTLYYDEPSLDKEEGQYSVS